MKNSAIKDLNIFMKELESIPNDTDEDYFYLDRNTLISIVWRFLDWELSQDKVEHFIELLEARDGITFENEDLKEDIHSLSNYRINNYSFKEACSAILNK